MTMTFVERVLHESADELALAPHVIRELARRLSEAAPAEVLAMAIEGAAIGVLKVARAQGQIKLPVFDEYPDARIAAIARDIAHNAAAGVGIVFGVDVAGALKRSRA